MRSTYIYDISSLRVNVGLNIMVMSFNNWLPYVHVSFHDQFAMWYQNRYMMCAGFLGVGGCRLARVGYCGTVNIGHDEDLELGL